jgi:hypothetical protein
MRIVVAHKKSQLVEIDAKHDRTLGSVPVTTVYPALTISRRRLRNGFGEGRGRVEIGG